MNFNPYSPSFIKKTLKQNDLWLSDKRGQNYLIDQNIAQKIVNEIPTSKTVFEVGTGLGALTHLIAEQHEIYSLEIDKGIIDMVSVFLNLPNIHLIHGDILKFDIEKLPNADWIFVSNVPYSISGEVIRLFIEWDKFDTGILMLQKEFVERMSSPTGTKNYGILGILCQTFLSIDRLFPVNRTTFFPAPSIDSEVVRIRKKNVPIHQSHFKEFLASGFYSRRKTLRNNMKRIGISGDQLENTGVDPALRPEQLSVENWQELFEKFGGK